MHASVFHVDLGSNTSAAERGRAGRALAAELDNLPGFVAFLAFEEPDGIVAGICICVDEASLTQAQQVAETWQRSRLGDRGRAMSRLLAGHVIVQRGF